MLLPRSDTSPQREEPTVSRLRSARKTRSAGWKPMCRCVCRAADNRTRPETQCAYRRPQPCGSTRRCGTQACPPPADYPCCRSAARLAGRPLAQEDNPKPPDRRTVRSAAAAIAACPDQTRSRQRTAAHRPRFPYTSLRYSIGWRPDKLRGQILPCLREDKSRR